MLLTANHRVPIGPPGTWSYELKFDGFRCCATLTPTSTRLVSRHGTCMDSWFPSLFGLGPAIGRKVVLDGEIVVLDARGHPDFHAIRRPGATQTFVAFDILEVDGVDVCHQPLRERQQLLEEVVHDAMPLVLRSRPFDDGEALLAYAEAHALEGIVAKRTDSRYHRGVRSDAWRKIKTASGREEALRRLRFNDRRKTA